MTLDELETRIDELWAEDVRLTCLVLNSADMKELTNGIHPSYMRYSPTAVVIRTGTMELAPASDKKAKAYFEAITPDNELVKIPFQEPEVKFELPHGWAGDET